MQKGIRMVQSRLAMSIGIWRHLFCLLGGKWWNLPFVMFAIASSGFSQDSIPTAQHFDQSRVLVDSFSGALGLRSDMKLTPYPIQVLQPIVFNSVPSIDFTNNLIGKSAGTNILRGQGGIEAATRIVFRGHRSLNQNNQPLIVLDGIPMDKGWDMLNPEDIQEISVLTSAGATSLYGMRGQNGALIIQTKLSEHASGVTYRTTYQSMAANPLLDMQQVYGQGSEMRYYPQSTRAWGPKMEGQEVSHWSPSPAKAGTTYAYAPGYDLADFLRRGSLWTAHLGISGKLQGISTYFSYKYLDAKGILPNNDLNRHNLTLRVSSEPLKKLKYDVRINYINQDVDNLLPPGNSRINPYRNAYQVPPNLANADISNFEYTDVAGQLRQNFWIPGYNGAANPYWTLYRNLNQRRTHSFFAMANMTYTFDDHLHLLVRTGLNRHHHNFEEKLYNDTYLIADGGRYSVTNEKEYEINHDLMLFYSNRIARDFGLNIMMGAAVHGAQAESLGTSTGRELLIPNTFHVENTDAPENTADASKRRIHSIYLRNQIDWKDRIRLELGLRNDWSSTLAPRHYAQLYPFAAASCLVSEMVALPSWVDLVKIRTSLSKSGNNFSPYQLHRKFETQFGTMIQVSEQMLDSDLFPEKTYSKELGLDIQLFKGRLQSGITYYQTTTEDHLIELPLPVTAGGTSLLTNGGKVRNRGIEFTMNFKTIQHKHFEWVSRFNITKNRNKVLSIHPELERFSLNRTNFREVVQEEGSPWGQIYSPYSLTRNENGSILVEDDGLPGNDVKDVLIANMNPNWVMGIQQLIRYKNLSLAFSIDWRQGGTLLSVTDLFTASRGISARTLLGREGGLIFGENFFSHEKAVTRMGELNKKEITAEQFWTKHGGCCVPISELFVKDASNARLRDITLTYRADWWRKIFRQGMSMSIAGSNLFFLFNRAEVIDPEVIYGTAEGDVGWEMLSPPPTKSISFRLEIGL